MMSNNLSFHCTLQRGLIGSASIMVNQSYQDIEDDGGLDVDAITCFCVSYTKGNSMLNCVTALATMNCC